MTPTRSLRLSWSMIVARSAGWSSARPLCGTRSLTLAIDPLDRVDVFPVDVPLGHVAVQPTGDRPPRAFEAEPAEQAGRPHVDCDEVERALDLVEPEVVDANDLATVDVDDLAVHQVLLEADLVGPLRELADVDRGRAEYRPAASREVTELQWRKISRPLVLTTIPVTGGYRSPMATIRSATVPIGSPCLSRTGRPIAWLR